MRLFALASRQNLRPAVRWLGRRPARGRPLHRRLPNTWRLGRSAFATHRRVRMTADLPSRNELLRRFFAGLTEYAFAVRMGVADPPLVDYVSEMLVRFVKSDALYGQRTPRGERLIQVADMLAEAEARQGLARRRMHRH